MSKLSDVFSKLTQKPAAIVKPGIRGNTPNRNNRVVAKSSAEKAKRNSKINEARGIKFTPGKQNKGNKKGTPQSKGM